MPIHRFGFTFSCLYDACLVILASRYLLFLIKLGLDMQTNLRLLFLCTMFKMRKSSNIGLEKLLIYSFMRLGRMTDYIYMFFPEV